MELKKEEILKLFNLIKGCTYSISTSEIALLYIKLKEVVERLEAQRTELATHIGKEKTKEFLKTLYLVSTGNNVEVSKECLEFSKNFNDSINKLLQETVEFDLPNLELDVFLNENKLKAEDAAFIYKIFNKNEKDN